MDGGNGEGGARYGAKRKTHGPMTLFCTRDNGIQSHSAFCINHPNREMHAYFVLRMLESGLGGK
jgi:hypothetical protein